MGNYYSKQPPKRPRDTGASSPTPSKRPRPDVLEESPLLPPSSDSFEKVNGPSASGANFLLPSSDSLEKINVLSESGANSRPSASSTSVIGNNYHVFLSFRGPDTRKSFVDHLYHRLKDVGLKFHTNFVFRDDESLPFGEDIAANLLGAIERSKVSIPVISENYAASEWCLRELIHIMECKESREQIVLPVLYKVKPKDVRHLGGSFGEAFRIHEHRFDEEVKQQGPTALKKALNLRVFESEEFADGCEGKLVNELVEIIVREQQRDFQPHLPVNLVGIEDRVAEVMKLVDIACPDTRIIGIWGMGGIGKTTLATIIYNRLFNKFKCRSFLQDIRETTRSKGMEYVQYLMISDITKNPKSRVHDSKTGITMIRSSCEKKVLILLDDVDRRDHLEYLIGDCNFKSGSRIIITCRDKTLLKSEYKMYELKEMNHKESFLLFSRYAFGEEQLPTNLATLSSDIVATTGGLPLALMVIGSLLNGVKDQMVWRDTLEKLRNAPNKIVKEKLRTSYDTLEYKEQQMFLDIACFFVGTNKRIATYLWEDLKFFPIIGLQVLIHCSLIKIDDNNLLRMHDQLRDLGRAIARPEDVKPWHWHRPWDMETTKILGRKEENEYIEALRLDERGSREFMEQESFKKMPNLKFLHVKDVDFDGDFKGSLTELRWLKWERCHDSFEATNFHLEKLVVLDLSGDYGNSLLLYNIHAFEEKPPPKELATLSRDIVDTTGGLPLAFEVIGSLLKEKEDQGVWRETLKELSKEPPMTVFQKLIVKYDALKYEEQQMFLDIACFFIGTDQRIATYLWDDLKFSPKSGLARMVELSLIKVDEENELTMHDQLRDLGRAIAHPVDKKPWDWSRLWDEEAMKVLGRKEENLSIEALRLDERGSREFMEQESFKKMPNLKFLHVKDVDFDGDFEGSFAELRCLKWERCRDSFEATIFNLEKLVVLDLSGDHHSRGSGISENWRGWSSINMERLKVLNLSQCCLRSIPDLSAFKSLEMLILKHCIQLEEIDPSIRHVKCLISLNLTGCWSLKNLPEQLGELEKLEELVVSHTPIKEIPQCIGSLKKLKRLSIGWGRFARFSTGWGRFARLSLVRIPPSIGKLGELLELNLSYTSTKELPESIGELNKLKILKIVGSNIERLPSSIGKLQSLQELLASNCELEGQILIDKGGLSSLKTLNLRGTKISGLSANLDQLSSLENLDLFDCFELESFPKPPYSLSFLRLACRSNELPSLYHLTNLQELWLWDCGSLQSIPELPSCIRMIHVAQCPKLERLPNLSDLQFLSKLGLEGCTELKKLDGLEALKSLRELRLDRFPGTKLELSNLDDFDEKPDNLHAIEGLEKLGSLEVVDISARKHIQVLDLSKSKHLKELNVRDCKSLVEIRCPSKFLEYFNRDGCESLKILPDFFRDKGK